MIVGNCLILPACHSERKEESGVVPPVPRFLVPSFLGMTLVPCTWFKGLAARQRSKPAFGFFCRDYPEKTPKPRLPVWFSMVAVKIVAGNVFRLSMVSNDR